jgi:phage baseplate assembly protein W
VVALALSIPDTNMKFKRTLGVTPDGDIKTDETKQLVWRDGPEGVAQELRTLLQTAQGEDPIDPRHGLNVFDIAGAPPAIARREIRRALLRDDRVASVGDIRIDRDEQNQRNLSIEIEVRLVDETELTLDDVEV